MATLVLVQNLASRAMTQFTQFEFESFIPAEHQSEAYGVAVDGLYKISRNYRDDAGADIDAVVQFKETLAGVFQNKRLRKLVFGLVQDGALTVTVHMDEQTETQEYEIPVASEAGRSDLRVVSCTREQFGAFIGLVLSNVDGAWFDLHAIDTVVVVPNHKFEDGA